GLVERDRAIDVADPVAGVDELRHVDECTPSSPDRHWRSGRPQYAESMLIERSMSSGFLTNTYLAASTTGGPGFLVEAGGPMAPLFDFAVRESIDVTHLLLTHHHHDHVCDIDAVKARYPKIIVMAHPDE